MSAADLRSFQVELANFLLVIGTLKQLTTRLVTNATKNLRTDL